MDFSLDYDLLVYHVKEHSFLTLPQTADYQLLFLYNFFPPFIISPSIQLQSLAMFQIAHWYLKEVHAWLPS